MSLATLPQGVQCAHFGTHERKNSLLLVTQIHHGVEVATCKTIDKCQLQRVEVLHLINLYPVIPLQLMLVVGPQRIVGKHQQVLKIQQLVLFFVCHIMPRLLHLFQQGTNITLTSQVVCLGLDEILVHIRMREHIQHRGRCHLHSLHLAQCAQRRHVPCRHTFRV